MGKKIVILLVLSLTLAGCVVQFIPDVNEDGDFIVVEGLITDQNASYKVRISRTWQIDPHIFEPPLSGEVYNVYVTDDLGNKYDFKADWSFRQYESDPLKFRGETGRKYVLHIISAEHIYESSPMELKPVPPIDSVYAVIEQKSASETGNMVPGYQLYVDAFDPLKRCNFYRWDFNETWEFRIPYTYASIVNRICWKTLNSNRIYIKNTSVLTEDRVIKFPLNFITTETDRLKVKYSIMLRQLSLNQEEFNYWEKVRRMTEEVGGLYDVVPMSLTGNIRCVDNPDVKVLGYFSVSSVATRRLFIKNSLTGFRDFYSYCPIDTVPANKPVPSLNISVFIIEHLLDNPPPYGSFVLTNRKECVDCTRSGSNIMPPFWNETKSDVVIQNILK